METVYWSHFAEKRGGSLQNSPPPPNLTHEMARGILKVFGVQGFLSYVPSGCRRVDVVGGVVHGQAFFPGACCWCHNAFCISTCCAISTTHAKANMVDYWDGGAIEIS